MPSAKRSMAVLRLGLTVSLASQLSVAAGALSARDTTVSALTEVGCFSSSSGLTSVGSYTWQSQTHCQEQCVAAGHTISAVTGGSECLCGDTIPPKSSKEDDSKCSQACNGWPSTTCGGPANSGYYQVFYATEDTNVPYASGSASSSSGSSSSTPSSPTSQSSSKSSSTTPTTTAPATIITSISPGKTVIVTQSAAAATNAAPSADKSKGGSNTAGIAAGVVVGIVVIAGLIGAAYFFWRRRQRQMQHQQMPDFNSQNSHSPMSYKPGSAGVDSRLNHDAMAQRRVSNGSIADNEDYSRRILKVTNPDDR